MAIPKRNARNMPVITLPSRCGDARVLTCSMMLLAPNNFEKLEIYSNPHFEPYCLNTQGSGYGNSIPMSRADFDACPWQRVNSHKKPQGRKSALLCFRPGFVRISDTAPHVKDLEFKESINLFRTSSIFRCFARLETRIAWMARYQPTFEQKRNLFLAMAMGLHPRIGGDSPVRAMDDEILRLIFRNLTLA